MSLNRNKPLARGKRINPSNARRRKKTFARNFGERGEPVREMGCLCNEGLCEELRAADTQAAQDAVMSQWCSGPIQACHTIARGMGGAKGDRRNLVPLCAHHHTEFGERGTSKRAAAEKRHGLNLQAEALRIAEELDARGLS